MTLPNFLIVGAVKSGTTSLYEGLRQHPEIFMPELKEPSFFIDWAGGINNLRDYESLFAPGNDFPARGEASTPYLYDPEAPQKIKQLIPEAKILIILRNPADMAYSLWRMMRRQGKDGEKLSFSSALNKELRRMEDPHFGPQLKPYFANFFYFHRGLYYEQVKRYLRIFGNNHVQIRLLEDFKKSPKDVYQTAFQFLGVRSDFIPIAAKENVGQEVHHRGLEKWLKNRPSRGALFLSKLNRRSPPKYDESLRRDLLDKYRSDLKNLEELIGRDLSIWS